MLKTNPSNNGNTGEDDWSTDEKWAELVPADEMGRKAGVGEGVRRLKLNTARKAKKGNRGC